MTAAPQAHPESVCIELPGEGTAADTTATPPPGDAGERAHSAEYELWLRSHFDDWSPANKADLLIMLDQARAATQPTPPPEDIGERARKLIGSLVINHGMGCVTSMLEGAEREAAAFLQSERTAAASQALLGAALVVEDEQDRGGSLAGAAHRLRALAHPQESAS